MFVFNQRRETGTHTNLWRSQGLQARIDDLVVSCLLEIQFSDMEWRTEIQWCGIRLISTSKVETCFVLGLQETVRSNRALSHQTAKNQNPNAAASSAQTPRAEIRGISLPVLCACSCSKPKNSNITWWPSLDTSLSVDEHTFTSAFEKVLKLEEYQRACFDRYGGSIEVVLSIAFQCGSFS